MRKTPLNHALGSIASALLVLFCTQTHAGEDAAAQSSPATIASDPTGTSGQMPLLAQQAPPPTGKQPTPPNTSTRVPRPAAVLEEVVVTATKREMPILKVPVSVAAIEEEEIEKRGAKNLEDLARSVPSLVVLTGDEQALLAVVIRGIGAMGTSATVATYVDDTPLNFGGANPNLELFDVQRVEVLRGPQGTLFGSSAMGGAIRYVSPPPNYEAFSGFTKLEVGQVYQGGQSYEAQLAAGGPLSNDRIAVRASVFDRRDGGYIDEANEDTGAIIGHNVNSIDNFGGRFAFSAKATDRIEATLSLIAQQRVENQLSISYTGRGNTDLEPLPPFERVDRVPNTHRLERVVLPNLTVKADLGFADLTSSTSLMVRHWELDDDFTYIVQRLLGVPDSLGRGIMTPAFADETDRGRSEELRLASKPGGRAEWLLGVFYRDAQEASTFEVQSNLGTVIPSLAPQLLEPNGLVFTSPGTTKTRHSAVFGEGTYAITDALKVTAGVRYTDLWLHTYGTSNGLFNGGFSSQDEKSEQNGIITPKYSVSYEISPTTMVYSTAAKGFREGGPNAFVPLDIPACTAELALLGRTSVPLSVKSDSLWSYEVGAKGRTDDRRFSYQTAVYDIEWSGIQELIQLSGGCPFSYLDNVGKARSRGFELETAWVPSGALAFGLSAGYTDARLAQDLITGVNATGPVVAARSGTRLPNVPEWTTAVSAQYNFDVRSPAKPFLRADYQYIGKSTRTLGTPSDDLRTLNRTNYSLAGLRLGATLGAFDAALFCTNVFNQHPIIYQAYGGFSPGPSAEQTTIQPRYIGISASRRF